MLPSLQEQLQYLTRTVNPDYIIILQHKANENMDFSTFRIQQPEHPQPYKPQKRYTISSKDAEDESGLKILLVHDNFLSGREVYRCSCNEKTLEMNMKIARGLYKGSNIEDKI